MPSEVCNLCFASCENIPNPIEGDARQLLTQILPRLDVKNRSEPLVSCTNCSTSLTVYLEFKTSFVEALACKQFLNTSDSLNLRQVYLQNEGNGSEVSADTNFVVCRFCMKQTTGAYLPLVEDQKELSLVTIMIHTCFPGMDNISGCMMCISCHEALEKSYDFITSLDVEKRVKEEDSVEEMEFEEGPDLKTMLFKSDGFGSVSDVDLNAVKEEGEGEIETDETDGNSNEDVYNEDKKDVMIKEEDMAEGHSFSSFEDDACDVKEEQTDNESSGEHSVDKTKPRQKRGRKLMNLAERSMFKCQLCLYESKREYYLTRHMLIHKSLSEVTMYKCKSCSFETRHEHGLASHERSHLSEVPGYKCDSCSYQTKHRNHYHGHLLVHKDPSEVNMYKCEECSYETKFKNNYNQHKLIHKNPSEITMYKCEFCTYETKYKSTLSYHQLNHKDPSEVPMYKCKLCSYETKHKKLYNKHVLVHKASSETTMYKCESCTYETRHKRNLVNHHLSHKDLSQVHVYKCDVCSYETKFKKNYNGHVLVHKSPSQVTMYKCGSCTYETKHKRCLRSHKLQHEPPSQVRMYTCEVCTYETKYKTNYTRHVLVHHKTAVEATVARVARTRRNANVS